MIDNTSVPTSPSPAQRLRRNTASMMMNQGGRVLLQGAFFVLVARMLGVDGFGAFAGTVALVALFAPFGSLGAINLMIRHIAIDSSLAPRWYATAIAVTSLASCALISVLLLASPWIAPRQVEVAVIAAIAAADLLGARLIEVCGGVFQGVDRMFRTAIYPLLLHGARLLAALVVVAMPGEDGLRELAWSYLAASLLVAAVLLTMTSQHLGFVKPDFGSYMKEWRRGILFAFSLSSQSVYNDIDKALLARIGSLESAGVYSAAYRVVDMAFTPMRALLSASYARFFLYGNAGLGNSVQFARQLSKPGVSYCLFASVALVALADFVPLILGASFNQSVDVLRALAILPFLKALHYLAADALTGADLQGIRTVVQVAVAGLNVALCLLLIPERGAQGAVIASLASDGTLAILMWGAVLYKLKRTGSRGN